MTVPSPEKTAAGDSRRETERRRRLLAREYVGALLDRALEENEYRSTTMPWPPEEHPFVMEEVRKVRGTLYVQPGALR
jgi:hypothetical protein